MQVPAPTKVAVVPDSVQTLGVDDAKLTTRPELADALRASVVPVRCVAIGAKLIVCAFGAAVTVKLTGVLAETAGDVLVPVIVSG